MTLNEFVSKYTGKKIDLFSGSKSWFVNQAMFRPVSYHQVFNSVIEVISVNVVNYLRAFKFSSNILLNNFSITFPSPSRMIERGLTLKYVKACFRTECFFASFSTLKSFKNVATFLALKKSFSRFVITISTTKSSLLTWRSFKKRVAFFTNAIHIAIISHNELRLI